MGGPAVIVKFIKSFNCQVADNFNYFIVNFNIIDFAIIIVIKVDITTITIVIAVNFIAINFIAINYYYFINSEISYFPLCKNF